MTLNRWIAAGAACVLFAATAQAQPPSGIKQYVKVDAGLIALTHARVIDGTGAKAREHQTLILRDGNIAAVGNDGAVKIPDGAQTIDLTGKTIIPGLVMMHEHLFYLVGPSVYSYAAESFTRLYLAGGVTAMRTAGNISGYGDLGIKRSIDEGKKPGPWIDATAPYLSDGLGIDQSYSLKGPEDAKRTVDFWADAGATSFKVYMNITRADLAAVIQAAHARGLKVTGHLCSVTYREALGLGIDNFEHTVIPSTDFMPNKEPDKCPGQDPSWTAVSEQDPKGAPMHALLKEIVDRHVALTSTMATLEMLSASRTPQGIDVLDPVLRESFEQFFTGMSHNKMQPVYAKLLKNILTVDHEFARMGGLLMAGTDPSVPGIIPGYADQREIELLVELGGFTPEEAIKVCSLNAATYLGRADRIGSIAAGKQADLVIIDGNPLAHIEDVRHVETVFKQGVGYDPKKLIDSVRGKVGLY